MERNKELQDLLHLFIFFIPIFSIIILHSTLYDGWRHLYFIYPSFLMVSLSGLNIIIIKFLKIKINSNYCKFNFNYTNNFLGVLMIKKVTHTNMFFSNLSSKTTMINILRWTFGVSVILMQ